MTVDVARADAPWLALREPADAAARSRDLVECLRPCLPRGGVATVHDLGCGTGSMHRWLAPQLSGRQHWLMYDRDDDLLARATAFARVEAADGAVVSAETLSRDITRLTGADLAGASLITASALLDMFGAGELERFVTATAEAGCAILLTLSVTGRVELTPPDSMDEPVEAAFNAHQRRIAGGVPLLGPDAVRIAADAFTRLGREVLVRPSPWHLGARESALASRWLDGWVGAACEQQPGLVDEAGGYLDRRLAQAVSGRLDATVHHDDLLVLPR